MALPKFFTTDKVLTLIQTTWASMLDFLLANPLVNGRLVYGATEYQLTNGVNVINHGLARKPLGWFLTDQNAAVTVYRSQPFNASTLTLTASANALVNLYVF